MPGIFVSEQWAESPCEQLLALFLKHGPEFITLLDGEFNLVIYQPDANRLLVFIACALFQTQSPLPARTIGDSSSPEVQVAGAIAQGLGFKHRLEAPDAIPLSTILPQIVWRTDGAIPFIHGRTIANHAQLKRHADFMAGGWLGDASSGAYLSTFMLMPYTRAQFLPKVHHSHMKYHKEALRCIFQQEFIDQHMPELSSVFFDSFAPIAGDENWQAFELWDLQERQTRMTFCAGPVDSHLFERIRPFLDLKYLNFALSLPPYLRYGQVMYQAMIYHLGAEIRHVPNANTGLPLKGSIKGNLLDQHYEGGRDHPYPISMMATLAAGLPTFVYQRPRRCPVEVEPVR